MDDIVLLDKIRQNDYNAFNIVVDRYYKMLYAFSLNMLKDADSAGDIAQDVFLKLWTDRKSIPEVSSLKSYLFIIARNRSLNHIRSVTRRGFYQSNVQYEQEDIDLYIIEQETIRLLLDAIDLLPRRSAEVIMLSLEGLRQEKIAEQMDISVATVKALKSAGIRKLKEVMGAAFTTATIMMYLN